MVMTYRLIQSKLHHRRPNIFLFNSTSFADKYFSTWPLYGVKFVFKVFKNLQKSWNHEHCQHYLIMKSNSPKERDDSSTYRPLKCCCVTVLLPRFSAKPHGFIVSHQTTIFWKSHVFLKWISLFFPHAHKLIIVQAILGNKFSQKCY